MCCRYVAAPLDTPRTPAEKDRARWPLLHRNAKVYDDHRDRWFVEFVTDCKHLRPDHKRSIYDTRPDVCREHAEDEECEAEDNPYRRLFRKPQEFDEFISRRRR
jgi:hypothetical protein